MGKGRLEAFSDGVLAIVITIMVLELKVPHGEPGSHAGEAAALFPLRYKFLSYVLSFVHVGIYWNNHHHMLHAVREVNGRILWWNLHLLFWLSLVPFVTAWMGENHFAPTTVALYGAVLGMAGVAYFALSRSLIAHHGDDSALAVAVGGDNKGRLSVLLYAVAIPLSFVNPWIAFSMYVAVAVIWLVPDKRIEKTIAPSAGRSHG
jgi:uncharacterized membrane protein